MTKVMRLFTRLTRDMNEDQLWNLCLTLGNHMDGIDWMDVNEEFYDEFKGLLSERLDELRYERFENEIIEIVDSSLEI